MNIYLLGYQPKFFFQSKHTNWWPWNYLKNTFIELGYQAYHLNWNQINPKKPAIYICWNEPDSISLLQKYDLHRDSIIVQKLTSFDASPESSKANWTENPAAFFKDWHWPQYQKLETLANTWPNFYAFGAKTISEPFPEKNRIVQKFKDRIFWIPWGSMTVPYKHIQSAVPILNNFKYDVGFVGSRWGTTVRGNIREWDTYLSPIIDNSKSYYIAGKGTPNGPISVEQHERVLKSSKICPIIHATSWKLEQGIMDRFWTVFSLGRFGVVDNEGVLEFYNKSDVVLEIDPNEYIQKSIYFMNHVEKQRPYIESVLRRIKQEYNQQNTWKNILSKICV